MESELGKSQNLAEKLFPCGRGGTVGMAKASGAWLTPEYGAERFPGNSWPIIANTVLKWQKLIREKWGNAAELMGPKKTLVFLKRR